MIEDVLRLAIVARELRRLRKRIEEKKEKKPEEEEKEEVVERVVKPVERVVREIPKPFGDVVKLKKISARTVLFDYSGRGKIYDLTMTFNTTNFRAEIRADRLTWSGTMEYLMELSPADSFLKAIPMNSSEYLLGIENISFEHYFSVTLTPLGDPFYVNEAKIIGVLYVTE